jgi:putative phosphoserine phosphatase/1-acylglycerol-3-phosphate O-acyltransferase
MGGGGGGGKVSRSVAIFDLDHGILTKPATTLVNGGGLVSTVVDRVADLAGPFLGPLLTSRTIRGVNGVSTSDMREAAKQAAAHLELAPHALSVLQEHRKERRRLVGTTKLPIEAAEQFAVALGFDDVIATKMCIEDNCYDGNIDGPLVHGRGKLEAARAWAAENGASLRRSYYFSGSFADVPLLAEVGRPVVIDPDPQLAALAWLKGWPTRSLHAPAGVPTIAGMEMQDIGRPLARPELIPFARFEFDGLENIPAEGAAIVVGNHRSYFDGVPLGLTISQSGRTARFLGKKEVFDVPVFGMVARWIGGIRVERGTGSDEPLEAAAEALRGGEVVGLMPQGTIPRGPAFFDPELKGRWGAAKLAAMSKAPVIPIGIWGAEKVWPRSARVPKIPDPRHRPLVTVKVGKPIQGLTYSDFDADTKMIMSAIVDLLPDEAKVRHDPTDEELALTYPAGYQGDPNAEIERRPGTD